jgi:hypothetical protein
LTELTKWTESGFNRSHLLIFPFAAFGGADYGSIMKTSISFMISLGVGAFSSVFLFISVSSASADQVTLRNGDVLNGKVLAMTTNTLTLQDDTLGTLTLARVKVSNITFGTAAMAAPAVAPGFAINSALNQPADAGTPNTQANSVADSALRAIAREIGEHSNLVQEVEAQVMGSSASPEADSKFNEMLDELASGKLDMNGLRAQAQSAADQLQEYKKELGPDAGEEVDGYLSILNHFLNETSSTNSP